MKSKNDDFQKIGDRVTELQGKGFNICFVSFEAETILFKDKKENYSVLVLKNGKYYYSISRVNKEKVMQDMFNNEMASEDDAFYKYKGPYNKQNEVLEKEANRMLDDYVLNVVCAK